MADGGVTEAEQRAGSSWGSQLDLAGVAPPMQDMLELDYEDNDEDASEILLSDDKYKDEIFIHSSQTSPDTASRPTSHGPSMDMQNVCKCT